MHGLMSWNAKAYKGCCSRHEIYSMRRISTIGTESQQASTLEDEGWHPPCPLPTWCKTVWPPAEASYV